MMSEFHQFDVIPYPVVFTKHSGQVLYVNQSAIEFSKIQEKDLLAMSVHDTFHPKSLRIEDCPLCDCIKHQNDTAPKTFYYEDRDSWYEITSSPVNFDSENDGALQMFVDVTRNVSHAETKFDSALSVHALLGNMPIIYYRIDKNEMIQEIVGAALPILELNSESQATMKAHDVFSALKGKYDRIRQHKRYFFESQHATQQGDVWFFHYVFSESGCDEISGFALDVTSMKRAHRATLKLSADKRALARRMLQMQEDVRFKVARDLHDDLGQTNTAIRLIASSMLNSKDMPVNFYRQNAENILDIANNMYDAARELMYSLRPVVLDTLGLKEALQSCIKSSGLTQTGVEIQFEVEGDIEGVEQLVQLTLFRVVQETLTNIGKYAKASIVQIRLERKQAFHESISRTDMLELLISDNGIGIKALDDKLQKKQSMGILGLQERVQALGGILNISSNDGEGVTLFARINLTTERVAA